ncbi:hypothetical protein BGZ83_004066 [Gryganskiella cystojenkinii]|nr:hypothetical protein BGZ83_004066 [Gryganskiella cystojenkinii]
MAARFLDMALDDVAKSRASNNKSPAGGRRGGRGGGRDSPNNRSNRSSPYNRNNSNADDRWTHDKYEGRLEVVVDSNSNSNEGNPKIIVENLHYAVTLEDIKELFNTHAGPVKLAEVKYDLSGRSTGVATILFKEPASAAIAIKKLHEIALDGQPMKISYAPLPPSARGQDRRPAPRDNQKRDVFSRLGSSEADIASRLGKLNPVPRNNAGAGGSSGPRQQSHNNQKSAQQQQQQKRQPKPQPKAKTAEELDAEMDTYMGDATA